MDETGSRSDVDGVPVAAAHDGAHDDVAHDGAHDDVARTPDGEPLTQGRRMTYRAARNWLKRADALVGRRPCGHPVQWASATQRPALSAQARQAEGEDHHAGGDVLVFRLADGRAAVVIDEVC